MRMKKEVKKATKGKVGRPRKVEGEKTMKKAKLGSGKRFKALTEKIEKSGKSAKSAKAIAASVGRKKYGAAKMSKMAAAGRKRKA